jgi:NAD(P)-dependent dehydrogenase (short-subunit alcohol dehydrogenase family)
MQSFHSKTAFITGAGSGMGLGMARTFAKVGMNVVLCDIRREALDEALAQINALGAQAIAVEADVSVREQVEAAAQQAFDVFGKVHLVCANAGISMHGVPVEKLSAREWDWVFGVNVHGVIHCFQTFLPHMREHGEESHIVNTASIGGFQINPAWVTGPYSTTKYAVVALSETLEQECAGSNIGVSVLAPAAVNTGIFHSAKARPDRYGGATSRPESEQYAHLLDGGLPPDMVGERVLDAIRAGEFFIFTHAWPREALDARHARINAAFDDCEAWYRAKGMEPPGK